MHKKFLRTSTALVASSVAALLLISNSAGAMEDFELMVLTHPNRYVTNISWTNDAEDAWTVRTVEKDYLEAEYQYDRSEWELNVAPTLMYYRPQKDSEQNLLIIYREHCEHIFELQLTKHNKGELNIYTQDRLDSLKPTQEYCYSVTYEDVELEFEKNLLKDIKPRPNDVLAVSFKRGWTRKN